ncbi:MAG: hypothetical protein EXS36_06330 [Pedosphaera sp.]|nr:hypothetical protein [Pedosphaera sp.]
MRDPHAVVGHWKGEWDEPALIEWAAGLRSHLAQPCVSVGLLFASQDFAAHAPDLLEILRVHARIPLLVGSTSQQLVCNGEGTEGGLVLGLFHLPGARLEAHHLTLEQLRESADVASPAITMRPPDLKGWIVFADPSDLDGDQWMRSWNEVWHGITTVGGITTKGPLFLNGSVIESGAVALAIGGQVGIEAVVSQGCTPIGQPWTITRAEWNFIHTIANKPAYQVLVDTFNSLPMEEREGSQGNLFVGLAGTEYQDEFGRGDFLVRNLVGADPRQGILAVGALPRAGQTIQFQRRDPAAATKDLGRLLARARMQLADRSIYGGMLCCCSGRGARMFGRSNPDSGLIQEHLGPLPLVGFFANGEIGPTGHQTFLHAYTAALALFVSA